MQAEKIKLLIVDDHAILRQGLRRILEAEPDMVVVGEAATGTDAVKRAKQLKPDVVIMDISMPEQDGIESMRQIVHSVPARVLILTVHLEHQVIAEAVSAGASGYLAKDSLDHELVAAVRTVVHGGTVFSPNVSKRLAESSQLVLAGGVAARSLETLNPPTTEVFFLLSGGKTA